MTNPLQQEQYSIQPWLTVLDGERAVAFYKAAFGATETYRLDEPGAGVVVRLNIQGATYWVSDGAEQGEGPETLGGNNLRLVLIVSDPAPLFARAIAAGAAEIFPVGEGHGWRLGRLADPFGLNWEIGCEL